MSKRKASEADICDGDGGGKPASIASVLTDAARDHRDMAAALLSLLPPDANKHSGVSEKLTKAFPLVAFELDRRARVAAQAAEDSGTKQPIEFQFVASASGNHAMTAPSMMTAMTKASSISR